MREAAHSVCAIADRLRAAGGFGHLLFLPLFSESLPRSTLTSISIPFVQDNPSTITDLLLRYAPEEDLTDARRLAIRVVHLNMASIHTSCVLRFPVSPLPLLSRDLL
jgi:hypothetical protein